MNKNERRYQNEMNLVKINTSESIYQVMKMMYHDLGYHRKDSLLHSYDLIRLLRVQTDGKQDYILDLAFIDNIYTKSNLVENIKSKIILCKKDLKQDKIRYKARLYLAKVIDKAIDRINDKSRGQIVNNLSHERDMLLEKVCHIGTEFSSKYDSNRLKVLKHELAILNSHNFNTTLYTFQPRTTISGSDPTLRKPTCNPKIEYPRLIHFEGLSQAKANKVIKLRKFKANLDVDFRPAIFKDLRKSFKEWFNLYNINHI